MVPGDDDRGRQVRSGLLGFDPARPWVAILPEPSAPAPASRLETILRLSVQIRGLTVAQFPNVPLALWALASIVRSLADGGVRDVAEAVAAAMLIWWALEELFRGVNWFRRALGAVVGIVTVIGLISLA